MRLHSAVIAARRRHRFLHHAARFHARRLSLCRHHPAQTYRRAQADRLDRTRYPDSRHRRTRQLQRDVSPLRGHRETPDRRRRCNGHSVAPTFAQAALVVRRPVNGSASRTYEPPRRYSRQEVRAHNAKHQARMRKRKTHPAPDTDIAQTGPLHDDSF